MVEMEKGAFHIYDLFILPQECTSAGTEIDQEELGKYVEALMRDGRGAECGKVKLWWHSHAAMSCYWSGTDEENIRQNSDTWFLSLVVNKKNEYKARLDVYHPIHLTCECTLSSKINKDDAFSQAIAKEVEAMVKKPATQYGQHGNFRGSGSDSKHGYSDGRTVRGKQERKPPKNGTHYKGYHYGVMGTWKGNTHTPWWESEGLVWDDVAQMFWHEENHQYWLDGEPCILVVYDETTNYWLDEQGRPGFFKNGYHQRLKDPTDVSVPKGTMVEVEAGVKAANADLIDWSKAILADLEEEDGLRTLLDAADENDLGPATPLSCGGEIDIPGAGEFLTYNRKKKTGGVKH